jgi:crotonobetainyl-CoA:carnitine CoA-transferase CaiB-like acyl-CoA transferase
MLKEYTVLDFTDDRGEIGPMLLGDLGADVIRVELPTGSASRQSEPRFGESADGLKSLQYVAFNRNKRSIVLDPSSEDDLQTLRELVFRADFIFESSPSNILSAYKIGYAAAKKLNDRIIYIRISPFGDEGPHAEFLGNDLVVAAMGGPVALQGDPDREPIRLSVPQVWRHAGVEAAAGAMAAHARMLKSGEGQFVDVSAQCVMTWTMLNAMDAHALQGFDFQRLGAQVNNGMVITEIMHPTKDGYIVAVPLSGVILGCMDWMIADGVVDESYRDIDWEAYDVNAPFPGEGPMELAEGTATLRKFFALHDKNELFEFGLKNGVTLAPVNNLEELLSLQHLLERDYWRDLNVNNGPSIKAPGLWAKPSNSGLSVRRDAPELDEHGAEIRAALKEPLTSKNYPEIVGPEALPFEGIQVADFAWVGVGPISAKYLADHGADVIRIESEKRPDVLRIGGPHKDGQPGLNRSQFFGDFNTSKKSLGLDLKNPEAIEIARELISKSDVMIESFAPGAIERMGLSYEEVSKLNPRLIMISTCLMGQTGPACGLAGYGYHASAIAGFNDVTGFPDLGPYLPWVAYTDTIAPRFISILLASALDNLRRTGEGVYIDVAQIETALHFLAPEILDFQSNGYMATRMANRSRFYAPQGVYSCAGDDNWIAIGIETDEEFVKLCNVLGRSDWVDDQGLQSNEGRLKQHDEIDRTISEWTKTMQAPQIMSLLQASGIPAGVVQKSSDLLKDPQYGYRDFYRYLKHPEMGTIPYAGHQYQMSAYNNGPRSAAPILGEHSFEILGELLGMSDEAIAESYAKEIVG